MDNPIELANFDPANTNFLVNGVPIAKFVHQILVAAIKNGASDIHFEPYEQAYRIRYRQDGLLMEVAAPPLQLANRISTRIKVLANLDIAEHRLPQDGHFQMKLDSYHTIDFRVSTCPTVGGEKLVVRILDTQLNDLHIDSLGLNIQQKQHFLDALKKPQGLILVTGPTGSGKTLSLYAALSILNSKERNILTVEDPVEIKIPGINQINVNPKSGLTFSTILRSLLRQDPDIIMIGEIRDEETAEIAIKAAQTGHLVLSTLHANNAAESFTRLMHLGVSSFNIANAALLLIAQRLARRLCEHCKIIRSDLSPQYLIALGISARKPITLYEAKGCAFCANGYRGRLGLFEVMPISAIIRQKMMKGANSLDIQKLAQAEGVLTVYQAGLEKVRQGLTTLEEIHRITTE